MKSQRAGYNIAEIDLSIELTWFADSEVEGLATDGEHFYISTAETVFGNGDAWLYKLFPNGTYIDEVLVRDGTLNHCGGLVFYDGLLWIPLSERGFVPNYPSKIVRYDTSLLLIDEWINSSSIGNVHWGGISILPLLERVYIANYGTSNLYVYDLDRNRLNDIRSPPSENIQDFVEVDGVLYCSKPGATLDAIHVWEPADSYGNSLQSIGVMETDGASSGLTWFDGAFWTCEGSGSATLHKLSGLVSTFPNANGNDLILMTALVSIICLAMGIAIYLKIRK
ncbi:MAG: DUF6454 family protein [Candidatus Thorarchaeota archaeon]|jgi:hypothetical protein